MNCCIPNRQECDCSAAEEPSNLWRQAHSRLRHIRVSYLSESEGVCVSLFFLSFLFNMLSQIRKCDAVTVEEEHTMALCPFVGLVA